MLFAVHCLDHADALPRRLANYDAHKAYLAAGKVATVISGPLVAADGATMIGSLFVFSADSIEEVKVTCQFCNRKAIFNMRLLDGKATAEGEQIQLGGDERYVPVCFICYDERLPLNGARP